MSHTPQDHATADSRCASAPRRRWFAGLAVLGGLGALAMASRAHAMGGWGRGGLEPEEMARRMDYRLGRMVKSVGGTPEQKDKISAIAKAAMADLGPLREQHRAARKAGMELLAAPSVDRAALEKLRASQMQLADSLSRRVTLALADAAEVLTPEQRAKLGSQLRERMERRHRG